MPAHTPDTRKLNGKPSLEFILDWYDAWLRTDNMGKVVEALNISSSNVLCAWMKRYPELKKAKELAESRRGSRDTFSGYIFKHLSKDAQGVWDQIKFWDECKSFEKIEVILSGKTKRIRQELFIHALVSSSFDVSEALRMVAITRETFEHWRESDLEFRQLVEEIQWHKKNFFEHALMDLVELRHPSAVMFVNRTINADRGYSEKLEVNHSGSVQQDISIDDLDLDIETRKKILEALRIKRAIRDVQASVKHVNPAQLSDAQAA